MRVSEASMYVGAVDILLRNLQEEAAKRRRLNVLEHVLFVPEVVVAVANAIACVLSVEFDGGSAGILIRRG
ncbi:hypothetical protein K458DRAFT_84338 [Lentithecium fluviatile CBS 122367]|uniref:Uncharacterized protein n=1 Tax=Lentithecium fluviatile CBS 122367 TaxID=1168545 RepID=A0A6G1ISV8_9PLEO|nr:hypothetical protein K458DRAFT_84338 [Lentithecium fluviatile CBS 122367]